MTQLTTLRCPFCSVQQRLKWAFIWQSKASQAPMEERDRLRHPSLVSALVVCSWCILTSFQHSCQPSASRFLARSSQAPLNPTESFPTCRQNRSPVVVKGHRSQLIEIRPPTKETGNGLSVRSGEHHGVLPHETLTSSAAQAHPRASPRPRIWMLDGSLNPQGKTLRYPSGTIRGGETLEFERDLERGH